MLLIRLPLHNAAEKGRVDLVPVLIQNGADVNAVDKDKQTALHDAAKKGHAVFALQLVCFGATIDDKMALEVDKTGLLGEIVAETDCLVVMTFCVGAVEELILGCELCIFCLMLVGCRVFATACICA